MSTFYLDRKGLELRTEPGILVLYEEGRRVQTMPLILLERLVIQARTGLDSKVLLDLVEAGISLTVLGGARDRRSATLPCGSHSDTRIRLGQYRLVSDASLRMEKARLLLRLKVSGQAAALRLMAGRQPRQAVPLRKAEATLRALLRDWPLPGQVQAPGELLGREGAAALHYFRALTHLFPPSLEFSGRNRRPPRDPVNACLSLAYTLLHAETVREAQAAGLDPMLGFLHRPAWGREALATDLVEPLRPRVDLWVWSLFHERLLRADHFATDKGACLLQKAGRREFYAAWEAAAPPWRRRLRRDCRALVRELAALAPREEADDAAQEAEGEDRL